MKDPRGQSGFVLVLVLVVIAICGAVLVASARRCGQDAVLATQVQQELQFRWGASSCRAAVLPVAEKLIEAQWRPKSPVVNQARVDIALGAMKFHLTVADESAKANVNLLARERDTAGFVAAIRRIRSGGRNVLSMELRPSKDAASEGQFDTRYANFEQLFSVDHPSEWIGGPQKDGAIEARRLTFWGDGKVSLRRADLPVLREVLAGVVTESQLADLDRFRRVKAKFSSAEAFAELELTQEEVDALKPLASEVSTCHSLWVTAEGMARSRYRLYVERSGEDPGPEPLVTLAW
ncbi:MAG: hypothetical protein ACE15C_04105 [Phycisphaerae bacterium]